MDDPFVQDYDNSELEIAAEFLTNWLPFLTRGLCDDCSMTLGERIRSLQSGTPVVTRAVEASDAAGEEDPYDPSSPRPDGFPNWSEHIEPTGWDTDPPSNSPKVRMSWADMAQEDELEEEEEETRRKTLEEEVGKEQDEKKKPELSREQREQIRFRKVGRKKDFICLERVKGKIVNILDGLELHTGVFSAAEQKRIADFVYELQEKGRNGQLREHTYSEPQKWMRGKGRVTIQFGCCYNYALDKSGNPPGILRNVVADPMPSLFKVIIRRLVRWHVLPTSCVPDSCIVNIYEPGDCIPPHIDNLEFIRPFCTVSFLSECNILFGSNLKITGAGEFSGSTAIPLPMGSVLILNGNGADVAKHCVPAVPTKRISITFRKMDVSKQPFGFTPEPDLQNIQTLPYDSGAKESQHRNRDKQHVVESNKSFRKGKKPRGRTVGAKFEPDFQDAKKPPYQIIDARSATSILASERGGRESFGSSFDSKRRIPEYQDARLLQDEVEEEALTRPSQQEWRDEESSSAALEGRGAEFGGRRVRLEQRRIIVSRNMEEEVEHAPMGLGVRGHNSDPARFSQARRRTLNNGRRRDRVSLSDD